MCILVVQRREKGPLVLELDSLELAGVNKWLRAYSSLRLTAHTGEPADQVLGSSVWPPLSCLQTQKVLESGFIPLQVYSSPLSTVSF